MPFTTPATVSPGDKYNASAHNIIVGDVVDLDSRLTSNSPFLCPVGSMLQYGGNTNPTGWLICNGDPVSRTTYAALFAVLSTSYGTGDGSTTFNLPDLRGRVPVGKGTNADVDVLGDNDGAALANRRVKHNHVVNQTAHTHAGVVNISDTGPDGAIAKMGRNDGGNQFSQQMTSSNANITIGPQTTAPTDGPSFLTVNYIIKT